MEKPLVIFGTADCKLSHCLLDSIGRISYQLLALNQVDTSVCHAVPSTRPTIAVIDLECEETDLSILEELRKSNPNLPVLVIASNVDALAQCQALARLATDYLLKPVDSEELSQKIQELCSERAGFNELSFHAPRAIFYSGHGGTEPELAVWLTHGEKALVPGSQ